MTAPPLSVPPEVARSAVEWWLQQQEGELPEPRRRAWQAWREADPLHEQAWQHITSVNQRLTGLIEPEKSGIARAALSRPDAARRRRRVVQSLVVLAFGGGLAWQTEQRLPWRSWTADVRTARGERRELTLADGTRIVLNGASALDIDYGPQTRRLRLIEGEVLITTARDPQQPARDFLVQTAQGVAQALGTRFAVRIQADGTSLVSVFDGAVRLRPGGVHSATDGDANNGDLVLQAGQQAVLGASGVSAPQPAHEDSLAWTEGMLVARGMPLADMLAALQPYSTARLSCEPQAAGLRISGTYPLDDVPRVLAALGALPGVRVVRLSRWWGRQDVVVGLASQPQNL